MSNLFWPGDERAGDLISESALLAAMVEVESAWLQALVTAGIAEAGASFDLGTLIEPGDVGEIALGAEDGGNPVIGLVALLRRRLQAQAPPAARWLHRGLTSQDTLDTALMLCMKAVLAQLESDLIRQVTELSRLAGAHRASTMPGRTLTQHAVPITFGLKAASWLDGVLDAAADLALAGRQLPVQLGGAAGTLAALAELIRLSAAPVTSAEVVARTAALLGLSPSWPWHTNRSTVTRIGDALARCTDAWGRIANDVLTLSRPEIGELAEPAEAGRGGSSTMPQKVNPVLSVLIKRAALSAPMLAAQLHLAAAQSLDERPDGAWHTEWQTLSMLARRTLVASGQAVDLLAGLRVDAEQMRRAASAAGADLLAEQRSFATLFEPPAAARAEMPDPGTYLGSNDQIIDAVLARAESYLRGQG